jgi:hypothetical protein
MKRPNYKTMGRAAIGMTAGLVLLMSFQNCGKAGFDAELDNQTDSASTSDAALTAKYGSLTAGKVSNIPFAFDAGFDTMTYVSCADSQVSASNAFFSLKAGAYSTGGIKLSDEFWNYADQNFSPIYPAASLSANQYKKYLADSPTNSGATPTMAVRVKNSLTDVYTASGSVTLGTDVVPLLGNLTDALVMDTLVQKGVTSSYFPFSAEAKTLEGSMKFNSNEELADQFRNIFMSSGALTLSYMADESEIYKVRAADPGSYPVKSAYGKSYSLVFSAFPGGAATNPNHVLSQVIETDLSKASTTAKAWNCSRAYKIIRTQDAATYCPSQNFSDVIANDALRNEYAIVRRQLRADQWDINVTNRCVVPKAGVSCYKEESVGGNPVVEYNLARECFRTNSSGYAGSVPNSRCLHFATICTRD